MQRVTIAVFLDCNEQSPCRSGATQERSFTLNYEYGQDGWGLRPLTLNSRGTHTQYQVSRKMGCAACLAVFSKEVPACCALEGRRRP